MFEVIEELSTAKCQCDEHNEDGYVITDRVVAVFDGATDKANSAHPKPGRQAMLAMKQVATDLGDTDDPEIVAKQLHLAVQSVWDNAKEPVATAAVLLAEERKVVRIGDISVGINGKFDVPRKRIDEIAAAARAALLSTLLTKGASVDELRDTDPGREMILPLLQEMNRWANVSGHELGFPSINGNGTPTEMIDVFEVPVGGEVVLASDGYVNPQATLESSEQLVEELNRTDPLCIGPPPGTKGIMPGHGSFDDRTYVRVRMD